MAKRVPVVQAEIQPREADASVDSFSVEGEEDRDNNIYGMPAVKFEPVNIISYPQASTSTRGIDTGSRSNMRSSSKSQSLSQSNVFDEELHDVASQASPDQIKLDEKSGDNTSKSQTENAAAYEFLDEYVENLRQILQDKELLEKEFSFDCLNQVYFLEQIEESAAQLGKEEEAHLENAKQQLMYTNRHLIKQHEIFKNCLVILNFLIDKWNILREAGIDFKHKNDTALDVICILNTKEVKENILSIDILWMTCENSPLRYMYAEVIDMIPDVQVGLMDLMNILANIAINSGSSGQSFIRGRCDILNFAKLARLKKKTLARLTAYVKVYRKFEKKVLLELYKLTAKYYETHRND